MVTDALPLEVRTPVTGSFRHNAESHLIDS